jgi:hypothetical protein
MRFDSSLSTLNALQVGQMSQKPCRPLTWRLSLVLNMSNQHASQAAPPNHRFDAACSKVDFVWICNYYL